MGRDPTTSRPPKSYFWIHPGYGVSWKYSAIIGINRSTHLIKKDNLTAQNAIRKPSVVGGDARTPLRQVTALLRGPVTGGEDGWLASPSSRTLRPQHSALRALPLLSPQQYWRRWPGSACILCPINLHLVQAGDARPWIEVDVTSLNSVRWLAVFTICEYSNL